MDPCSTSNQFRVIVIGGGPVGLLTAHLLAKESVDFVLLEQHHEIKAGSSHLLSLSQQGLEILHQLGLSEKVKSISTNMAYQEIRSTNRKLLRKRHDEKSMRMFSDRSALARLLYDSLPDLDQARILTGKKMAHMYTTDDGVVVTCADGSSHRGTLVVGADGLNSRTRDFLHQFASRDGRGDGNHSNHSRQTGTMRRKRTGCTGIIFHLLKRKLKSRKAPDRAKTNPFRLHPYTHKYKMSSLSFPLDSSEITLYDALQIIPGQKVQCSTADIQKNALQSHHSHSSRSWNGRIVLVGDACHSMLAPTRTTSTHELALPSGQAFTNGALDAVALVDQICRYVHHDSSTTATTASLRITVCVDDKQQHSAAAATSSLARQRAIKREALQAALERYQSSRIKYQQDDDKACGRGTRPKRWKMSARWFMD